MQILSRLARQITNYKSHDPPFTLATETVYTTEVQVWKDWFIQTVCYIVGHI